MTRTVFRADVHTLALTDGEYCIVECGAFIHVGHARSSREGDIRVIELFTSRVGAMAYIAANGVAL